MDDSIGLGLTVLVEPERPNLDVVFVHGFTGSPTKTWTHKKGDASDGRDASNDDTTSGEPPSKSRKVSFSLPIRHRSPKPELERPVFWPRDLLPKTLPDARVLTYGYDTHIRHKVFGPAPNRMTLGDFARDLLVSLEAQRRPQPSRPILFICHSLGGNVAKEMLRQSHCSADVDMQSISKATVGAVFFGTPHHGADPRGLTENLLEGLIKALGFRSNNQIVDALLPTADALPKLNDEFSTLALRLQWRIYCFQEACEVKLLGKRIVENTSSSLGIGALETRQHINRNHMDICRFKGLDDPEYQKVSAALGRTTAGIKPQAEASVLHETLSGSQRTTLYESLGFKLIDSRFRSVKRAHANTCRWFLKSQEYRDWLNTEKRHDHNGFLWIKGKPGAGKSTLMKFIYANFRSGLRSKIFFFFNARGEEIEKTTVGMYRSLLSQLLDERLNLRVAFDAAGLMSRDATSDHEWNLELLKQVFEEAVLRLERSDPVTCFIDALDECDETEIRDMVGFLEQLAQSAMEKGIKFKVIFSSRHYPHITIIKGVSLVLESREEHTSDIQNYINSVLRVNARDGHDGEQILDQIQEKASGVFMWVVLVVDILNQAHDQGRPSRYLLRKLQALPDNLHDLFRDILTRDQNNRGELLLCLQWVLFARRPLTPVELYYAIHLGTAPQDLDGKPEPEQAKLFITNFSKGLAEVVDASSKKSSAARNSPRGSRMFVQFIHESVRDFLLKEGGLKTLWPNLGEKFEAESHERLKRCCDQYLCTTETKAPTEGDNSQQEEPDTSASSGHPFLEYSTQNVLPHAEFAAKNGIPQGDFLSDFNLRLSSWTSLYNMFEKFKARQYKGKVTLLYVLSERNLVALIRTHFSVFSQSCLDIEEARYGTPLFAARATNSDDAALALIEHSLQNQQQHLEIGVLLKNSQQRPALCPPTATWSLQSDYNRRTNRFTNALSNGDYITALIILSTYPDEGNLDASAKRKTILGLASSCDDEVTVKLLLHLGANIEERDGSGRTPLFCAAEKNSTTVLGLLLNRGAQIDAADYEYRTPLIRAMERDNMATFRLLLNSGANIEVVDSWSQTPLSRAARLGRVEMAGELLNRGAEVNAKDYRGRTPLSYAVEKDNHAMTELLLTKGANTELRDNEGRTPLAYATSEGAVELLLAKGAKMEAKDNSGRTPLTLAIGSRSLAVVQAFLGNGAEIDTQDNEGNTPLMLATGRGYIEDVKVLTDYGADVGLKNRNGETSLFRLCASVWLHGSIRYPGTLGICRILIAKGADVNARDNKGKTPLDCAMETDCAGVREVLLQHGAKRGCEMD
ncbi:hypothetical protein OQA88_12891 [Cercophora sp. LCS_1]